MLVTVNDLSLMFDKKVLYEKASFRILPKEKIGIIGPNGVGKTTLINILSGKILPDSGDVTFDKTSRIGYLDQYAKVDKKQTINEYLASAFAKLYAVYDQMNATLDKIALTSDPQLHERYAKSAANLREQLEKEDFYLIKTKIMRIATGLGITNYGMDTELGHLSGGQKVKIILAKLLLEECDLLVLDEPTNFLDTVHVDWLVKYLKEYKGAFAIVSHNQEFLNDVVNVILEIEFGKITKYKGNFQAYELQKARRIEDQERAYQRQQKEIAKLEDYVARNKTRAATAAMAKSREKKLDKMERISNVASGTVKCNFNFAYKPIASQKFLVVEDLEIGYYYSLLPAISFILKSGDKLAVTGFNGIGKTTLLRTLMGEIPEIKGKYHFVDNALKGYYEQEHHFVDDNKTPYDEIGAMFPLMSAKDVRGVLGQVGIKGQLAMQPIKTLSGGEQSKLKLCKVMLVPSNVLILDEPTNHLDQLAKEALLDALKRYQGTVIFVSHERDFIERLATKEFSFEDLLIS